MKRFCRTLVLLLALIPALQYGQGKDTEVMFRSDDFGMSRAVNQALRDMVQTGIPFNASVMMVCPWVQEVADILEDAPQVSIGLHLTLTSEFEQLKWGPITGKEAAASLVDERGYFRTSVKDFLLSDYNLGEIENELRAQVNRALAMGMRVDYLDHHMGIARSTPEIAAIVEKIAAEHGFAISRYFDENLSADIWGAPIEEKRQRVMEALGNLAENRVNLFVFHTARDNPEISGLDDLNTYLMSDTKTGKSILGKHRSAELNVFLSEDFKKALQGKKVVTYKDLKRERLSEMKRNAIGYPSREAAKEAFAEGR